MKRILLEPITVSITVLKQMFNYLTTLDVDIEKFLRSIDVDPDLVKSPDTQLPIETYLHIQDQTAAYTQDPYVCTWVNTLKPAAGQSLGI
ncbi:MAG: hypothetical protein JEZ06_01790 [Anaerolineaceae bacterium]|nr:hypothetical protein [Anaerolineaceae bacterium]